MLHASLMSCLLQEQPDNNKITFSDDMRGGRITRVKRTQPTSKCKFLASHCSPTPSPTVTLYAESKETALCLVKGGPAKLAGN